MPGTPEQNARLNIDALLQGSGWVIQDYRKLNLSAGRGIAVREVPLASGRCDYFLLVDRKPVGVVEAKKEGTTELTNGRALLCLKMMHDYVSASGSVDREHLATDNVLGPIYVPSANDSGRSWKN